MARRAPRPLRLLVHEFVTGGGLAGQEIPASWGREGAAMRRAVVADFGALPGLVVTYTLDARFRGGPGARPVGPGQEAKTLSRLTRESDAVLIIAPETGGILARRERRLRALGVPSLGSEPQAVALAGDKLAAARRLAALGVRVVPTRRHRPGDRAWDGPVVVKPRRGAGSIDTHLVAAGEDCPTIAGAAVVQPYLPGRPMSAAALVDRSGRVRWVGSASQEMRIDGGRFAYRGGVVPGVFSRSLKDELAHALMAWPGLAGWIGIDYLWDPAARRATVLEVNPRLTTSYIGHRARLGGPWLAAAWLHAVRLGPHPGPRIHDSAHAVRFHANGRREGLR